MGDAAAMLRFEHVEFGYPGGASLLRNVSLSVEAGEMVGVLGPNGIGKTTLVRLASGALAPRSGTVEVRGRGVHAVAPLERARWLAVVPQDSQLAFDFSVRDVVRMGRAPHQGLLGIECELDRAIVEGALRRTGIVPLADRVYSQLSGGERQRVVIARALAQQPQLLLLDEPTAFLDLKHQLVIYDLLAELNRKAGLTVVVVSHDVNLVARYCRRLLLLHAGGIAARGTAREVLTADNLRRVYGVEAETLAHGDGVLVLPRSASDLD